MKVTRIGLDIAKQVFQMHGVDENGKSRLRKQLARVKVLEFFAQLPPCLVGIEACGSSHYWGRELTKLGHTVKLMAARSPQPVNRRGGSCRSRRSDHRPQRRWSPAWATRMSSTADAAMPPPSASRPDSARVAARSGSDGSRARAMGTCAPSWYTAHERPCASSTKRPMPRAPGRDGSGTADTSTWQPSRLPPSMHESPGRSLPMAQNTGLRARRSSRPDVGRTPVTHGRDRGGTTRQDC
jgi:hypothetical protein